MFICRVGLRNAFYDYYYYHYDHRHPGFVSNGERAPTETLLCVWLTELL